MEYKKNEKWEQVFSYFRSSENRKRCQPFISECQRYNETAKRFGMNCPAIYAELSAKVKREEYGVGGYMIHRGFYNPSPVEDIIIGNAKRGKLLKRITSKSKPDYKYLFDDFGNLILVEKFPLQFGDREIIIRQNETETGIGFNKNGIRTLSECIYRGNHILSYILCVYTTSERSVVDYMKETFKYSELGLSDVSIDRFSTSPEAMILRQEKYRFKHDAQGYLSQYSIVEQDDGISKNSEWADDWLDIRIKRKI